MANIYSSAELIVAIIRVLLILFSILFCIDLINKTSGGLRKASIFFMVAFIPSALYTIGRILNIEALFASGTLLSLMFNALNTFFLLVGLFLINKLIDVMINPKQNEKRTRTNRNRKLNKEINIKNIIKRGK